MSKIDDKLNMHVYTYITW